MVYQLSSIIPISVHGHFRVQSEIVEDREKERSRERDRERERERERDEKRRE